MKEFLGIVASRIVEQTGKPTIVLGISEDGLTAKGSGRSFGEFNLYDALTSVKRSSSKIRWTSYGCWINS